MVPGAEGGVTIHVPDGRADGRSTTRPSATRRRGRRSSCSRARSTAPARSRDWAAKGTLLLGVRAVIAESYERIHRSNLVGMGVLPLQWKAGESAESLGLDGRETLTIRGLAGELRPRQDVTVEVQQGRRLEGVARGHGAARHAGRDRLLQERRHPADRAAQDARLRAWAACMAD